MKRKIEEILWKIGIGDVEVFVPEYESQGHYSTNAALRLAKREEKKQLDLARELAEKIQKAAPAGFFEKIEVAPPGFINFWFSKEAQQKEFAQIYEKLNPYGKPYGLPYGFKKAGRGRKIIVEYSQPNIAKKMHAGHLRTTIVGDALANVIELLDYRVIRWNYLGDWGTQFGKLIAAYKMWGDEKMIKADPINKLQELYVRFHDEIKNNPAIDKQGQEEFKKLEEGDKENRKLWKWFKKESLKEFQKVYDLLDIKFNTDIGESFYEKDIKPLVARLIKGGVAKESEGAIIIPLDKYDLPPALIQKSDGASLYLTRDIANLEYRIKKYKPEKIIYVVGNEQSLHFEQLFAIADILGLGGPRKIGSQSQGEQVELVHAKYGLVLGEEGKKLATREGRTVLLEDVLSKALELAKKVVDEKRQDLPEAEREEIAEAIGIGALKYGILKENRNTDITFNWKQVLDFTGDSAPYLQYTHARMRSILRKATSANAGKLISGHRMSAGTSDVQKLDGEAELRLMRKIFEFPDEIVRSAETMETNNLANYLYEVAVSASRFYETTPVLKESDEERRIALLVLVDAAANVIRSGLNLLGIKTPERI